MTERFKIGRGRSFGSLLLAFSLLPLFSLSACVRQSRHFREGAQTPPAQTGKGFPSRLVHINQASMEELEKLPGIGRGIAARIVAFRKEYGRFRRPEHLMMVRGISARRYEAVRDLITAE